MFGGVPENSSEDTWLRYLVTFRRVPVKMFGEVPAGSVKKKLKLSSCWG
jgi:hypothetical protein